MTDKNENAMDKLKGKGKEATGKVTGDRRKEAEGKSDQAKAKADDAVSGAADRAKGVKDSLTDDDGR
ncbi:CsbD family protein [Streptomyces sp. NPDC058330]|uniref:CsbD family protein n=1 Tax=Streptomyces sp. NPDC058330 TaxID=3346449 RepID=UPI0036EDCF3F